MQPSDFQQEVERTVPGGYTYERRIIIAALGLSGEAGEVTDHVKKWYGQGHELEPDKIKGELGDILWYVGLMANTLDLSIEDIMQYCADKLRLRYPDGFTTERSMNR